MFHPPARLQARECTLDSLAKRRPRKARALASREGEKRLRVRGRELGERAGERLARLSGGGRRLRRRCRVRALRRRLDRCLAAAACPGENGPNLPRRDPEGPGERVAARIELARPREDSKQRLLRRVLGFPRGQTAAREAAQKRPQPDKDRIERRPIAASERRQIPLERPALARIHPLAREATSDRTWRSSSSWIRRPCRTRPSSCRSSPPPKGSPSTGPVPFPTRATTSSCPISASAGASIRRGRRGDRRMGVRA